MFGTPRPRTNDRNSTTAFKSPDQYEAYWLGFIAADGHIRYQPEKHRYELIVEVNKKDEAHVEKLRSYLGFGSKFFRSRDSCVIFSFCSKQLAENLILWITPNNKTEVDNFSIIPDYLKDSFVRGYFDGDGHMDVTKFSITSCPATLLPMASYINARLSEDARVYSKKNNKAMSVHWNKVATLKFRREFVGDIRMERKWNAYIAMDQI